MCRLPLTVAAAALAILSVAPAMAGESTGQWAIDRGANAANVQVAVAPLPENRTAITESGCAPQTTAGGVQYTFPSASGVTIYISPTGVGPYLTPFGFGYGAGYGYRNSMNPQVVVWAAQGSAF